MCVPIFTPDIPKTTPVFTQNQAPEIDENARNAREEDRRRASAARGRKSTLLTGGDGLNAKAFIARKKLLGE
jgi:hypothetical protein